MYFFTVTLADRDRRLLVDGVGVLRHAFAETKRAFPFRLDAIVVLPEHLHCIWSLPAGDDDCAGRWRFLKASFSRRLIGGEATSDSRSARGERGNWQRRFWEHLIRDDAAYAAHADYIHYNPVRHGYVERAIDWRYSSFHRWVRAGVYPADWGVCVEPRGDFGERLAP